MSRLGPSRFELISRNRWGGDWGGDEAGLLPHGRWIDPGSSQSRVLFKKGGRSRQGSKLQLNWADYDSACTTPIRFFTRLERLMQTYRSPCNFMPKFCNFTEWLSISQDLKECNKNLSCVPHNRAETVVPDPELPLPDSTYTTCATRQFPADSAHVVGRGSTDGSNYTKCLATDRNCDSNNRKNNLKHPRLV